MAKKSLIAKANRPARYSTQAHHRCGVCGRPRAYMRKFGMCRICFRQLASIGQVPGIQKSSW
ncbi:MAG TPA: type Z 30S ribosomal protein S14 [Candidatus Dormibacteraeota bacterium]|jgi:small subunit ribosomal protein S14|nr:small subunit ribosomal protein [Chloroflexota bacterium]